MWQCIHKVRLIIFEIARTTTRLPQRASSSIVLKGKPRELDITLVRIGEGLSDSLEVHTVAGFVYKPRLYGLLQAHIRAHADYVHAEC